MKRLLCAIDLTHDADAREILTEAGKLAKFYGAGLSVVTVIPDFGSSWVSTYFKEDTMKTAVEDASASLHAIVADTLPDHERVQHIVEIGGVYEEVLHAAEQSKADLIVLGAHKPDMVDRLQGPNSARIVRHAKTSVLVLRLGD